MSGSLAAVGLLTVAVAGRDFNSTALRGAMPRREVRRDEVCEVKVEVE